MLRIYTYAYMWTIRVQLYAHMFRCVCIWTCVHMDGHAYLCVYTHRRAFMYIEYASVCVYTHIHKFRYAQTHIYTDICTYMCIYIDVCANTLSCTRTYVRLYTKHALNHTYTT